MNFIFMLTRRDQTVDDCLETLDLVADIGVRHIGFKDVGVELHSMSKGFNMTGWRLGFVAGNPLIVKAYADVKDNTDSGQFLAIQQACAYALDHPEQTQQISAKYSA